MKSWILWLLAAFMGLTTLAKAEPSVTVEYDYYDIYGTTARQLRDQMVKFGVTWRDGNKYDALTTWYTRWNYTWESGHHSCEISGVRTSVEVIHRLPRWANKEGAPPALKKGWERYLANLMAHESGHRDLGVAAASEIETAIGNMPAEPSCEALEKAANALGHATLDKYRELETEYDRTTGHGKTQGAVFP